MPQYDSCWRVCRMYSLLLGRLKQEKKAQWRILKPGKVCADSLAAIERYVFFTFPYYCHIGCHINFMLHTWWTRRMLSVSAQIRLVALNVAIYANHIRVPATTNEKQQQQQRQEADNKRNKSCGQWVVPILLAFLSLLHIYLSIFYKSLQYICACVLLCVLFWAICLPSNSILFDCYRLRSKRHTKSVCCTAYT